LQRVADQVRLILAELVREVRDPRLGFVTITEVRLSPDFKHARVFVSTLDPQDRSSLETLERATPFLRRALARRVRLRCTPELHFEVDDSISKGFAVEKILADVLPVEDQAEGADRSTAATEPTDEPSSES